MFVIRDLHCILLNVDSDLVWYRKDGISKPFLQDQARIRRQDIVLCQYSTPVQRVTVQLTITPRQNFNGNYSSLR
jgi:hypothetical protein